MKNKGLIPLLTIAVILVGLSVGSLLVPDRDFSANENRYLQMAPQLSAERIFSGDFSADAEKYTADQIAGRDTWMGVASSVQKLTGRQDINGVYLGKDGYYFAKVTDDTFDDHRFTQNLKAVQAFFQSHAALDCHILIAPSPATILQDRLPENAMMYDADARFDQIEAALGESVIDVRQPLSAQSEPYYHTDHHWTTAGAYSAYSAWCAATGHTQRAFELKQVSDHFRGTLYSKVLLPDAVYDAVSIAADAHIERMDCDGKPTDSLYHMEALQAKDTYTVFQGGNFAQTTITTGVTNGKHLLLIKDSFANSFVPFLTRDYETITMLDLRYFQGSVRQLVQDNGITDVLVLYEMSNFAESGQLFKLNKD